MGPDEQTTSDMEADAFFASFIDAPDDVIARVAAEADTLTGPDLDAIVAESAAFNYWDRTIAARNARRVAKQRAEAVKRIAAASRWAHPNEAARLAPLGKKSLATLPAPRIARLTDDERRQTARYWQWLAGLQRWQIMTARLKREAAEYERHQRWLSTKTAARAWRREQREFERTQWQQTRTAMDAHWAQRKRDLRWVAISEARALEIALAVYDRANPPQVD